MNDLFLNLKFLAEDQLLNLKNKLNIISVEQVLYLSLYQLNSIGINKASHLEKILKEGLKQRIVKEGDVKAQNIENENDYDEQRLVIDESVDINTDVAHVNFVRLFLTTLPVKCFMLMHVYFNCRNLLKRIYQNLI